MDHTMNDRELQDLLTRWKNWSRTQNSLGFKSVSIEYRLMREGVTDNITGSYELEDFECEVLDLAISKMPKSMKKIIKLKYLFGWTNKDAAKTQSMSLASYKSTLISSRAWLCGHMTKQNKT